jgi:hypothetical protein
MDKRQAFLQMLSGLLFVAIDITISIHSLGFDGLDVIPDVIGYALILFALRWLEQDDVHFRTARIYTVFGTGVAFVLMLPFVPNEVRPWLGVLQTVLHTLMVWYVCTGIIQLAAIYGNALLSGLAPAVRKLYVIGSVIAFAVLPIGILFPGKFATLLGLPAVLFSLMMEFLVMLLLWKAAAESRDLAAANQ